MTGAQRTALGTDTPLRVLHLARDLPPHQRGGLGAVALALATAERQAGHTSMALSFDDWRPQRGAKAPVAPDPPMADGRYVVRVRAPEALPDALQAAAAFGADVVNVHDALLWPAAASLGLPAVLTAHVVHAAMQRLRGSEELTLSLRAQREAVQQARAVLVPSGAARAALVADAPEVAPRVRVTPPGVDLPPAGVVLPPPSPASPPGADAGRACPLILHVGRFAALKGTFDVLDMLPRLLTALPGAHAVLAGGVPGNPKAERRWRRRLTALDPALARRVALPGWLPATALADLYARADVLLMPSHFETLGMAALEAMAHGVPVVAFEAGGLGELIDHGRTGVLVPVGDRDAMVAATVALLTDPAAGRRLGLAAAREIRARWSWTARLPSWVAAYRTAAGEPPPTRSS